MENVEEQPIEELELTVRTYNCLKRGGVNTVEQLKSMSFDEYKQIRNISRKSLNEIGEILNRDDLKF